MDEKWRTSARELVRALGRWWIAIVFSGLSGVAGFLQQLVDAGMMDAIWPQSAVVVPAWVWWVVSYIALCIGAFAAFHRVRVSRDKAQEPVPDPIDYGKEDQHNEWPIYQVAFSWCDFDPPPYNKEDTYATRETYDVKQMLHDAVRDGKLTESRHTPHAIYVSRGELKRYCNEEGAGRPPFLFPDER